MTFTFPLLLGGLLLVGLPVLLHLLMRQKPRTVLFPAFRFLIQRHKTNLTKLRLRHLLLMVMRMLLLAAIILALAQPRVKEDPWNLPSDQAVAAVFIFDTSASMEYTVAASQTRLKDAQKRALEILKLLPYQSEIVILDSADSTPIGRGDWLAPGKAADRINKLKLQPANGPVTARLAAALDLLARVANTKDDTQRNKRARVLCVFSDQTPASWDSNERKSLQSLANQVPPSFERLAAVRAGIAEQQELLGELDQRLKAAGRSYSEQVLIGLLAQLGERLALLHRDDHPETSTQSLLAAARGKQQDLLSQLEKADLTSAEEQGFRTELSNALTASLRSSAGFTGFYVDLGVQRPADLALADLQIVRQLQAAGDDQSFQLRVEARATGEDARPTMAWQVAGPPVEQAFEVKTNKREFAEFELDSRKLHLGRHQVKVVAKPFDQLPINNSRYLTYAFRRILVITDSGPDEQARTWARAMEANRFGAAGYRCEVKSLAAFRAQPGGTFEPFAAVFLYAVKEPDDKLWANLAEYVGKGGGLGVIPGNEDLKVTLYNTKSAQDVLPATLDQIVSHKNGGADWDWHADIFKHPLLHPFHEWRQGTWDLAVNPRGALRYWHVVPLKDQSQVLVRYADGKGRPALVERIVDLKRGKPGRVLLFTSPPGWANWNNYSENSFFVALAGRAVGYLSADAERPLLNFICGQGVPRVTVPITSHTAAYQLYRDGPVPPVAFITTLTADAGQNEIRVPQAVEPGNYVLRRSDDEDSIAAFSLNLPAEESELSKIPKIDIELVLGPGAALTIGAKTDLGSAVRAQVSQPWDLMPLLMLGLLLLLALENLLANKFYRRETEADLT